MSFKDYTRSTAFSISLSQTMVEALLFKWDMKRKGNGHLVFLPIRNFIATDGGLLRRGLLKTAWREWEGRQVKNGTKITKEGEKLCELLVMAGFEIPKLNDVELYQ